MDQNFPPVSLQAASSFLVHRSSNNEPEIPYRNLLLQMPNNFQAYQNQEDPSIYTLQDVSGCGQNWSNFQNQNVAETNSNEHNLSPIFYKFPTFGRNLNSTYETKTTSSKSLVDLNEVISNLSGEIKKLNVQKDKQNF